jgi:hypothetical protein
MSGNFLIKRKKIKEFRDNTGCNYLESYFNDNNPSALNLNNILFIIGLAILGIILITEIRKFQNQN